MAERVIGHERGERLADRPPGEAGLRTDADRVDVFRLHVTRRERHRDREAVHGRQVERGETPGDRNALDVARTAVGQARDGTEGERLRGRHARHRHGLVVAGNEACLRIDDPGDRDGGPHAQAVGLRRRDRGDRARFRGPPRQVGELDDVEDRRRREQCGAIGRCRRIGRRDAVAVERQPVGHARRRGDEEQELGRDVREPRVERDARGRQLREFHRLKRHRLERAARSVRERRGSGVGHLERRRRRRLGHAEHAVVAVHAHARDLDRLSRGEPMGSDRGERGQTGLVGRIETGARRGMDVLQRDECGGVDRPLGARLRETARRRGECERRGRRHRDHLVRAVVAGHAGARDEHRVVDREAVGGLRRDRGRRAARRDLLDRRRRLRE